MTNMDPVMELIFTKMIPCSGVGNPENDTLFSGTSPYGKIYEYPPPRDSDSFICRIGNRAFAIRNLTKTTATRVDLRIRNEDGPCF